jgi:hypothetical protein
LGALIRRRGGQASAVLTYSPRVKVRYAAGPITFASQHGCQALRWQTSAAAWSR